MPIINDHYKYGFHEPEHYVFKSKRGLDESVVRNISWQKHEPEWMLNYRLRALQLFQKKQLPTWGGDLTHIDFGKIFYYIKPTEKKVSSWTDLPPEIKNTYDRIGIPEAEKKFLAGVSAQYESEVVYKSINQMLSKKGVIFLDMDSGLREYPELVKQYFGSVVSAADNKFAALNSAAWSGGSFIYVPKGVRVELPLQAYFRINAASMGQFERTLIIADEGSFVHYVEGCFLAGAKVKTSEGEKPIEKVTVGDKVFTHNGRYKNVYRTMSRPYKGKIYTIQYYGESKAKLQITEEHPLLVSKRTQKEYRNTSFHLEWLRANQIEKDDYLVYPIRRALSEHKFLNEITKTIPFGYGRHNSNKIFHVTLTPDFYRLIGYFFAEGHVDKEHYITFTFHIKEKEYLEDVKGLLVKLFGKGVLLGKIRNHGQTITLCSTVVARYFAEEFGSTNRTKHIPQWVLESPTAYLRELVKGMWRGDGSYDKKLNVFRYSSVTKSLVNGFRDAILQLGIIGSINSQSRISPKQTMHNIIISRLCNISFGEIIGRQCKNGRKEGSPFYIDKQYMYLPIKSIKVTERATKVFNLSVIDDESYVAEGVVSHNCTAPIYTTDSLHAAVVEIIVKKGARVRYTTIQNWSTNVYNLVTKRARAEEEAIMEWVDGNLGSKVTMKYPSVVLAGRKARGEVLSIAYAGPGQHQDAGGKMLHIAPETTSRIISKSISRGGGRTSYRGLVQMYPGAKNAKSKVVCDALLLDEASRSDTYPTMKIDEKHVQMEHEATVSKIGDEQLFYLQSRGIAKGQAESMIVNGFIEPIVKELPLEYAVEMNRLIELQMEGSVG